MNVGVRFRRRGVGRLLFACVKEIAKERGCDGLLFLVNGYSVKIIRLQQEKICYNMMRKAMKRRVNR